MKALTPWGWRAYVATFVVTLIACGLAALLLLHFDPPARAATAPTPCVAMPDGANHNRYDRSQWTCPIVGSTHWLEVRLVHYRGKVIGMRVIRFVK